jgi:hypothetical protein
VNLAIKLSLAASGIFLMTGMLLGILKYRHMLRGPDHQAPFYIDTAHRAALLYSFAALVIAELLRYSPFSEGVQLVIAAAPLAFFAIAIGTYALLGLKNQTSNQFTERNFNTTVGMWLLIVAEVGGFGAILYGFFRTQFFA